MSNNRDTAREGFKVTVFQKYSILIICFLLYMVNYMDRQVFSVVLEPMKKDLGLTDTQAGLLQTGFFLSMALLAIPLSYLVDRWSRRKALTLMAIIWSVFTYVTGLGRNFLGILLPRMLVGVGEGGFPSAGTALISAAFSKQTRSSALGIFNASIPLGACLGMVLGGYLAGKYENWRMPFFMFAVPGIILGIVAFFLKDYKTVKEVDESGKRKMFLTSLFSLFKIPTLRWVYFGYAMQMAMTMAFIVWGPAFIMRAREITVTRSGFIMGIISLMGIIGPPLGGIIADLWQKNNPKGKIYIPLVGAPIAAILMALTIIFELSGIGVIFGLLLGIFLTVGIPAVNSISQDVVTPGLKGLSWGVGGFIAMLCGAAWAPSAVGAISDALGGGVYGLKVAITLMAFCGIIASLCFWAGSKHYPEDMGKVIGIVIEAEK